MHQQHHPGRLLRGGQGRLVKHSLQVTLVMGSHTRNLRTQFDLFSQSPVCNITTVH